MEGQPWEENGLIYVNKEEEVAYTLRKAKEAAWKGYTTIIITTLEIETNCIVNKVVEWRPSNEGKQGIRIVK